MLSPHLDLRKSLKSWVIAQNHIWCNGGGITADYSTVVLNCANLAVFEFNLHLGNLTHLVPHLALVKECRDKPGIMVTVRQQQCWPVTDWHNTSAPREWWFTHTRRLLLAACKAELLLMSLNGKPRRPHFSFLSPVSSCFCSSRQQVSEAEAAFLSSVFLAQDLDALFFLNAFLVLFVHLSLY